MKKTPHIFCLPLIKLVVLTPLFAHAHHPNAYQVPDSFFEGLLSGFGHPVIGIDHLVFILGVGVLAYSLKRTLLVPLTFVVSTLIGAALHLSSINILGSEVLVAVSVLLLGFTLVSNIKFQNKMLWATMLAASGILHGYTYGESIIGAEASALSAYLLGFSAVQLAICFLAGFFCQYISKTKSRWRAFNFPRVLGGGAILTAVFVLIN